MIRVARKDLDAIRLELDQMATSAFFMETYMMGMRERINRLKKYLNDLEMVASGPDTTVSSEKDASGR